jgi:hypothetical protein
MLPKLSLIFELADARVLLAVELAFAGLSRDDVYQWDEKVARGAVVVYQDENDQVVLGVKAAGNLALAVVEPNGISPLAMVKPSDDPMHVD